MLPHVPDFLRSAIAFVIVLGILVFIHELGHYLAARWRGVYVEAFSIGFGQPLLRWTDKVGTEWRLCWLPLGGYVKMHGQERPETASDEVRATWKPGQTFNGKSVGSRAIIVAAGPFANFVLAIVLLTTLFATAGRPVAMPVVGEIMPDSAAAHAGLKTGDRVLTIDGAPIRRFEDIQRIVVAHPGDTLSLHVQRGDAQLTLPVIPDSHDNGGGTRVGLLGIRGGATELERLSPPAAVVAGFAQTWEVTRQTFAGVFQMLSGSRGTEDLGGPLRIAQLSGQVAELGMASLVSFIALLSINIGLINLFPIPVLDGGHLLFYAAEALRGRPIPMRAQEYGFRAGFALLVGLFIFATWNDLSHLGLFRWVAALIG